MPILDKPPVELAEIASEIIDTVPQQADAGRPNWTKTVKDVLRAHANRERYQVYPDLDEKTGEWLLDLIWLDRKTGTVHLAVESELGKEGEVLDDFQKLLCIKSPLKIMVYYAEKRSYLGTFIEYMEAFDHHIEGEHYLLIEFAPGPADHAYLYRVPADGHLTDVAFSSLALSKAA